MDTFAQTGGISDFCLFVYYYDMPPHLMELGGVRLPATRRSVSSPGCCPKKLLHMPQ